MAQRQSRVFLAGIHPLCQTHFLGGINLVFDSPSRASQSVCAPAQLFTRLQGCAEFCTAAPHTFLCLACCGVANRAIRIKSDTGEHDDAGTVTAAAAFLLMEGRKAKKAVRRGFPRRLPLRGQAQSQRVRPQFENSSTIIRLGTVAERSRLALLLFTLGWWCARLSHAACRNGPARVPLASVARSGRGGRGAGWPAFGVLLTWRLALHKVAVVRLSRARSTLPAVPRRSPVYFHAFGSTSGSR